MRILFVSPFFPIDAWTASVGVHQRMRMFIDALKDLADLDVLFFVPSTIDTSATAVKQLERSLADLWNARMRLFLCGNFDSGSMPPRPPVRASSSQTRQPPMAPLRHRGVNLLALLRNMPKTCLQGLGCWSLGLVLDWNP